MDEDGEQRYRQELKSSTKAELDAELDRLRSAADQLRFDDFVAQLITYGYPPGEAKKRVRAVFAKERQEAEQAAIAASTGQQPMSHSKTDHQEQPSGNFLDRQRNRTKQENGYKKVQ